MLIRKMYQNGQITIPKNISRSLGFKDGLSLFIYDIKDEIYIEKTHEDTLLNQAVLSNGKLTIPRELRKILKLEGGATLSMEITPALNRIKLKKTL